ncbi:hypothetical protein HNY73_010600 [Argiope bruennichi]|uniref:Uncharacterized protein n=1 Tax=Argiope bruennichi TaxID=94029 RepID=A0A8T0F6F9_ARGBR|nr:hypothetical protein HNY73_010600 [Argiope bruennichi]
MNFYITLIIVASVLVARGALVTSGPVSEVDCNTMIGNRKDAWQLRWGDLGPISKISDTSPTPATLINMQVTRFSRKGAPKRSLTTPKIVPSICCDRRTLLGEIIVGIDV